MAWGRAVTGPWERADHSPIASLSTQDETHLYFLLEHASGGELFDRLEEGGAPVGVHGPLARHVAAQVLLALAYLHSEGVVHRCAPQFRALVGLRVDPAGRGRV